MDAKQRIKDKLRSAYNREDRIRVRIDLLAGKVFTDATPIEKWQLREAFYRNPGKYDWIDAAWRQVYIGTPWGGEDRTGFFRARVRVPKQFKGKPLALRIRVGGEALLKIDGKPFQGLDVERNIVYITEKARGDERFLVEIEAYVRQMFEENMRHTLSEAELVSIDRVMEDVYFDFKVAFDAAQVERIDPEAASMMLSDIEAALALIDFYELDPAKFRAGAKAGSDLLRRTLYASDRFKSPGKLALVSNSHIDLVYMWPYREFQRKIGRVHATQLNLLREFPDFIFTQSQPKMYEDIKQLYPEVYSGIRAMVKSGRWELVGAMYIEPDCNLVSGESFARQLLFGQRFFQKEFGKKSRTCWLPDVFGNSWIMPQILKQAGVDYFITNKLVVWNDTNEFPHNTFLWQGVDGSRVVAHFPTTHFGGELDAEIASLNWHEYKQKQETGEAMCNYGFGDGRGGPTREMIHTARRLKDFPGMPACRMDYAEAFFDRMGACADRLPVWDNELYLETHRGTYTTAGELKKMNRRSELLYRDAEMFGGFAALLGEKHPQDELNEGWKKVLKNQFHDILPGSHVSQAFHDAKEDYRDAFTIGASSHHAAVAGISRRIGVDARSIVVFNSLSWRRSDIVHTVVPSSTRQLWAVGPDGARKPVQVIKQEGEVSEVVFTADNVPPMGYKLFRIEEGEPAENTIRAENGVIETDFLRVRFGKDGRITSIIHKPTKREVLTGKGNHFQLFEDKPGRYSAWDIIPSYAEKEWEVVAPQVAGITETGPVRAILRQERRFMTSGIRQYITLYADVPRIDFHTFVRWVEREKMLKVAFPVDVLSRTASYDLSFGNIERPTHVNTPWDAAKFEVCAHQWADLSEPGFGVSILNDCKYGHDIRGGLMRLTLLRGATAPDPTADMGIHEITYSLYPHEGGWREAQTDRRAMELNMPMFAMPVEKQKGALPAEHAFAEVDAPNVFVSALKRAEDSNELVLRVYENRGARGPVTVTFDRPVKRAVACNLLEEEQGAAKSKGGKLEFSVKPYEIKTFKLRF